jgi:hypothetical protein
MLGEKIGYQLVILQLLMTLNNSGSFANLTAICRASSRVNNLAGDPRRRNRRSSTSVHYGENLRRN